MPRPTLEIAVQDAAGALIALENGAARVELCAGLGMGGATPSIGVIDAVVATKVPVHVLVRLRGGGFVYASDEVAVMVADVEASARAGVAGVVIGALVSGDLALDDDALSALIGAGRAINPALEVTVHRCVDVLLANGVEVESLISDMHALGVDRILTSGGASMAADGADVLAALQTAAAGRVQIQVGGGVKIADIASFAALDAIHLSARASLERGASGPGGGSAGYDATSPELVSAAAAAIAALPTPADDPNA